MKTDVTFWYQWMQKEKTKVLLYNHMEDGWCEESHPIPVSQQQLWWNSRDWCKKFGYLENGKAEELNEGLFYSDDNNSRSPKQEIEDWLNQEADQ